jgi:hypothetical protein
MLISIGMQESDVMSENEAFINDTDSNYTGYECDTSVPQMPRTFDGIEVITKYSFEVDSKGNVKPTFSGEIHRRVPLSTLLFNGESFPHDTIKKDAEFLVKYAQEILNQTPKLEEHK